MEVEVISRETIKPSTPTPLHLRSYKLSLIDQYTIPKFYVPLILSDSAEAGAEVPVCDEGQFNQVLTSPAFYIPLILFYPAKDCHQYEHTRMSDRLRRSLSEALSKFYPLAGKVHDNHSINCDDDGVEYLEARVKGKLNDVLNSPNANEMNRLLPCDLHCNGSGFKGLLAIQVSVFDCGGIAIAACVSHILADASTLCTFINSWADITRGADIVLAPKFGSASIFPPREAPLTRIKIEDAGPMEKFVSKRFVFDAVKIAALRDKSPQDSSYTRVEVVSALIWKCLMNIVRRKPRSSKSYILNMIVNLRNRMSPRLMPNSFGNLVMGALSPAATAETETEFPCLVEQLRNTIEKFSQDTLRKLELHDGIAPFDHLKHERALFLRQDVVAFIFTSWCKYPYYKADFGWGDPAWVTSVNLILKNAVTLMDTKDGAGIEAWVTLEGEDMSTFEVEPDVTDLEILH